jgi:hypothetical protein
VNADVTRLRLEADQLARHACCPANDVANYLAEELSSEGPAARGTPAFGAPSEVPRAMLGNGNRGGEIGVWVGDRVRPQRHRRLCSSYEQNLMIEPKPADTSDTRDSLWKA